MTQRVALPFSLADDRPEQTAKPLQRNAERCVAGNDRSRGGSTPLP